MTVRELIAVMEQVAPLELAAAWDNVGLIVGEPDWPIHGPILLTIDLTGPVVAEAVRAEAGAIVAYHPPIWTALRRLDGSDPTSRAVLALVRRGVSVYSPHTALDAASGGVTDWLCEGLSAVPGRIAGDCRALEPHPGDPTPMVKIVTFVPPEHVDAIRQALASAGAGVIGAYTQCSFTTAGTGTFFGSEGTSPATGQPGRLERVEERRIEMVCPRAALALALETLAQFHPYETPAVDVYPLAPRPTRRLGAGRRLVLDRPATPMELARRLRDFLGITAVKLACPDADAARQPITHIGVCPGSGAAMLDAAIADGCQLFVTGEMSHHQALAALRRGVSVLLAGHTNTERGYLPRLARRLAELQPAVTWRVSEADRSPFELI